MSDHDNRRKDDDRLEKILDALNIQNIEAQRVKDELTVTQKDLREWQAVHKQWCLSEFTRLDLVIKPIKEAYETVDKPMRWVGRITVVTLTGGLLWLGERVFAYFGRHWTP